MHSHHFPAKVRGLSAIVGALGVLLLSAGCGEQREVVEFGGPTMGTTWSVQLVAPPDALDTDELADGVADILDSVDREMSTWRSDSAVSRFNRASADTWFELSPRLTGVLTLAREVTEVTGGAFDITVGSLVGLWGFGPSTGTGGIPDQRQVRQLVGNSGFRHLHLRAQPPALKKDLAGLQIDLSAIAKGHAVDAVADWLVGQGLKNFLVEVGGELRVVGHNAGRQPWRVAVERPHSGARTVFAVLSVSDRAVATSGDYRNFFEADGKRYSHAIDPASGKPIGHALASVTVIDETAARADALATGLLVLGPKAAFQVARSEGLAVLLIERRGQALVPRWTPNFVHAVRGIEGIELTAER